MFKHIPTGVFTLDMALFGGIPESLITLIYGRESSGKTTLALRAIANAQVKYPDQTPVLIDVEGTYDPVWGAMHGINNDRLELAQPETGEQALDIGDGVLRARDTSIVVVDSLAMLIPIKELEESLEEAQVGSQAKLVTKFCRKAVNAMLDERRHGHTPALIMSNQWRTKIGGWSPRGDPRTLPGGHAQHYVSSVKIEVLNREHMGTDDRDMETVDRNDHSFKIAKNKMGSGIRNGEFKMIRNRSHPLGMGFIDEADTVATWAKKMGVITGGGSSWHIDDVEQRFRNRAAICDHLYQNMDYYNALKYRLVCMQRAACGLPAEGWY